MLKFFRNKNIAKMVLWLLLILILPAFVLWGSGSLSRSKDKGPRYVGTIDNTNISFEKYAQGLTAIRSQIILNHFDQPPLLDAFLKSKPFMGKLAWDTLLMSTEAKKRGMKITDREVIDYIKTHPIFSRNGRFDDRIYEYVLRNNMGIDPRTFEEIVRDVLAMRKLNQSLTKDIKVTDEEVLQGYRASNEKNYDKEEFERERDAYSKMVLEKKKNKFLEDWLRGLESKSRVNIDLNDYEKYYR